MALITYVTRVQFDFGARSLPAEDLAPGGIRRPLPDRGVVAAGGPPRPATEETQE